MLGDGESTAFNVIKEMKERNFPTHNQCDIKEIALSFGFRSVRFNSTFVFAVFVTLNQFSISELSETPQ